MLRWLKYTSKKSLINVFRLRSGRALRQRRDRQAGNRRAMNGRTIQNAVAQSVGALSIRNPVIEGLRLSID